MHLFLILINGHDDDDDADYDDDGSDHEDDGGDNVNHADDYRMFLDLLDGADL